MTVSTSPAVAMHPELIPGHPQSVRWVLAPDAVPFVGPVRTAPGALGELAAAGVIREVAGESSAVVITLADGAEWARLLPRVRAALGEALAIPTEWQPYDEEQRSPDQLLRTAVQEVLAGPAGDYVRSHGGSVTIASVSDGHVTVTFDGTCGHCPATGITLHDRLETEVRRRFPGLKSISASNAGQRNGLRLFSIRRRPNC